MGPGFSCHLHPHSVFNTRELSLAVSLHPSLASSFTFESFHDDQTMSFVLAAWPQENDSYVLSYFDTVRIFIGEKQAAALSSEWSDVILT